MGQLTRDKLEKLWDEATPTASGNPLAQGVIHDILNGDTTVTKRNATQVLTNIIDDIRALKLAIEETQ